MGFYLRKFFYDDNRGIGVVEMILILLDNPFTSSTYILSY